MVPTSTSARLAASPRRRWGPIIECGLLLALIVVFFAKGFVPAWRTLNTDFPNYFVASAAYRHHIPLDRVYEWTWFQRQKDRLLTGQPLVGFVPLTPVSSVPLVPLTHLSALNAKRVWLALNLLLLVASAYLLSLTTRAALRFCLLIAFLCVIPLRMNFLYGQFYVALLFLFCAAYFAHQREFRFTSGALLSVGTLLKLFPGGFLLLFLWKKDWRAALGLLCGALVLGVASIAMLGLDIHRVFLEQVFPRAMSSDFNPYVTRSLAGIWSRLFVYEPSLNPSPLVDSPLLAALARSLSTVILALSAFLYIRRDEVRSRGVEWAIFLQLLLLLSTLPASYHYSLLIFSAIIGFYGLREEGKARLAAWFLGAFVFSCAPWISATARLLGTIVMFLLLLGGAKFHENSRRLRLALLTTGVVLACVMTFSTFRTLTKQRQDYAGRVPHGAEAYRVSEPRSVPEGLLVTEMQDNGYKAAILSTTGRRVISAPPDVLAVAGSATSNVHYIEISGKTSLIARMEPPQYQLQILFPGQQPHLSSNGKWLGFIREENGRGSAWVVSTDGGEPVRMTASAYDVLELSVSDDGGLYAALGPAGSPQIVKVNRAGERVDVVPVVPTAARYPMVSPDGKRIAFSRLHRGAWQLAVFDLASRRETQLTDLPCNAIDPGWIDDQTIVYASDCGRGPDLTAISKITVP